MDLENIISELKAIGEGLRSKVEGIDCYLFGSILTNAKLANDIDVLIVYKNRDQLQILKHELKIFASHNPLHLSYFTFCEEQELSFMKGQKAFKIFSL